MAGLWRFSAYGSEPCCFTGIRVAVGLLPCRNVDNRLGELVEVLRALGMLVCHFFFPKTGDFV
jgi:hypothetical protein